LIDVDVRDVDHSSVALGDFFLSLRERLGVRAIVPKSMVVDGLEVECPGFRRQRVWIHAMRIVYAASIIPQPWSKADAA
jgi:hypothetical protein